MMILKKQPKSLLDEYHDLEAKIGQTKKNPYSSQLSQTLVTPKKTSII